MALNTRFIGCKEVKENIEISLGRAVPNFSLLTNLLFDIHQIDQADELMNHINLMSVYEANEGD